MLILKLKPAMNSFVIDFIFHHNQGVVLFYFILLFIQLPDSYLMKVWDPKSSFIDNVVVKLKVVVNPKVSCLCVEK